MSLINDALRKARTTQPVTVASSTARGPALRPIEASTRGGGGWVWKLPLVIAGILLLAGILFWAWYRAGRGDLMVRAKVPTATVTSAPTAVASAPKVMAAPNVEPTGAVAPDAPAVPASTATAEPAPAATRAGPVEGSSVVAAAAPKPVGPVYRLEGIFYRPKRPAAVINGELVQVGSSVEDGQVVAIDDESATVVTSAGQTNVLVLVR